MRHRNEAEIIRERISAMLERIFPTLTAVLPMPAELQFGRSPPRPGRRHGHHQALASPNGGTLQRHVGLLVDKPAGAVRMAAPRSAAS